MEEYKVLLTTSGLGSRLGEITNFTNKSLVRIGPKPAISYIIESYPKTVEFVITLGHFGDHVKEFLELAYPDRKFQFVWVDVFSGKGSSLVYSMLQTKNHLQCPFIFHACDTILDYQNITPNKNYLVGHKKINSSQYRTLNVSGSKISRINEKGELNYDYEFVGVAGINDYVNFWSCLYEVYTDRVNDSISDCDVYSKMMKKNSFVLEECHKWQDIGNVSSLNKARKVINNEINVLDKLDESIYILDNKVIKFFHNKDIVKKRVDRASILGDSVPKIIDSTKNFYKYELVEGELFSRSVTPKSFSDLLNWTDINLWSKGVDKNVIYPSVNEFRDICEDFYIKKTISRLDSLIKKQHIVDKEEIINDEYIPPVKYQLSLVKNILTNVNSPNYFHGDFILENIIEKSDGSFSLIDWRQDFGGELKLGDIHYDLAKLNHNLIVNHDIINDNLFNIEIGDDKIYCDINRRHLLSMCEKTLHQFILDKNLSLDKVKILTSIIWLNMSPLHHHPFDLFLYYFGKYNLWKTIQQQQNFT